MADQTSIKCPKCGSDIDVNDILKHQIEDSIRKEFQQEAKALADEMQNKKTQFENEKSIFEEKKKKEEELFAELLEKAKKTSEKEIAEKVKKQVAQENNDFINEMKSELAEKSEKLNQFNKIKGEVEKLKREKLELKAEIEADNEQKLNETLVTEREKIRKQIDELNELKFAALNKQLEDQKILTAEMKRKQDQGSMQLQGEVMELAIEEWLISHFPLDTIIEIKKGAAGADCLQIVNTREFQNCGTIYYESKRTKAFQPTWIDKFKKDIQEKNANIGVLVTEVLPIGMERMGMKEGIWICTFEEFKGLVAVLRETLIRVSQAIQSEENKGDKMELLYEFLTSNQFRLQVEGIVEGFSQMQFDLLKEKKAIQSIWKQREKQIDKVIQNTLGMYGSIRGIAGNAIQTIKALELDDATDLIEE